MTTPNIQNSGNTGNAVTEPSLSPDAIRGVVSTARRLLAALKDFLEAAQNKAFSQAVGPEELAALSPFLASVRRLAEQNPESVIESTRQREKRPTARRSW